MHKIAQKVGELISDTISELKEKHDLEIKKLNEKFNEELKKKIAITNKLTTENAKLRESIKDFVSEVEKIEIVQTKKEK